MRRSIRVYLGCLLALVLGAQGLVAAPLPGVSWATQAGGSGIDLARGVSALPDGSSLVTGYFAGTATFGTTTLTSSGSADVFIAKVAANGTWAWATQAGGSGSDLAYGVSALPDGSSLVTGYFEGTATFGTTTLTSSGSADVFIAKVAANGTWAWATQAGGSEYEQAYGVSALPDGSSLVTGSFTGTATFGTTTLTSSGSFDGFIAKVAANGTWAWATQAGGSVNDVGNGVSALPDGSSLVTGYFEDTATFGTTTLTSSGSYDVFIATVAANGTWVWATQAGGSGADQALGVSALPDGSSLVTGYFQDTATFGTTTLTSSGDYDGFIAKVAANGTWAWATQAGGSGTDYANGVSALPDGSSLVTGDFTGTATFGTTTLTSSGSNDVFIATVAANGTWAWATQAGGSGGDLAIGVSALPDGSSLVTGYFQNTATFGTTTLTSSGSYDGFIARYLDTPQAPATPSATAGVALATVTITPLAGGSVGSYEVTSNPDGKTCTVTAPATACTVSGLTNGTVYTFRATATNAQGTGPASGWSTAVTPTAAPISDPAPIYESVPSTPSVLRGKSVCRGTTCVTTGAVPLGATRITQTATRRPAGKSAKGRCTITRVKTARSYRCTISLTRGTWVITTTARIPTATPATIIKRVRVAPRAAAAK